jgi:GTP pyrophosphokinase
MNDYTNLINEGIYSLYKSLEATLSPFDMDRVKDAFELANEAHKEQRRRSGLPYIVHPIAVAQIVASELELGANPVIAALLHDVVEDTDYTLDDISQRFGDDVSHLVDIVTKRKIEKQVNSKQVENFRQLLESMQYDVRAVLIKLADRLHNMRTLESMRPAKQMKIAGETDYFYAPLAHRLGLYKVKTELENLSFRYRQPNEYEEVRGYIARYVEDHAAAAEAWMKPIREVLERYQIKHCYYGHLHAKGIENAFVGEYNGVNYQLISADFLEFMPLKIKE